MLTAAQCEAASPSATMTPPTVQKEVMFFSSRKSILKPSPKISTGSSRSAKKSPSYLERPSLRCIGRSLFVDDVSDLNQICSDNGAHSADSNARVTSSSHNGIAADIGGVNAMINFKRGDVVNNTFTHEFTHGELVKLVTLHDQLGKVERETKKYVVVEVEGIAKPRRALKGNARRV